MKFWNRLRWLATIVFVLFLAASWLAVEPFGSPGSSTDGPVHKAPSFTH
jgi:hypothetical protein